MTYDPTEGASGEWAGTVYFRWRGEGDLNGSGNEIEAVEVHYFSPNRDKIFNELLLRIVLSVDLCEGAKF